MSVEIMLTVVATSYGTFAVVQLLTLGFFSRQPINVSVPDTGIYMVAGALVFMLSDAMLYSQIDREKY